MESIEVTNYKFICFTNAGNSLMHRLESRMLNSGEIKAFASDEREEKSLSEWVKSHFEKGNILVFIGAVGIAVRAIAPFVKDKTTDPGVVVIDEQGRFVIPVLSGHIGGAVDAAKLLAGLLGATAVITTATDSRGEFSVDVFAKRNDLFINSMKKAKEYTASLLKSGRGFYSIDSLFLEEIKLPELPENIVLDKEETNGFYISPRIYDDVLRLVPKCLVVGIGCKKGKTHEELREFLARVFQKENLDIKAVRAICSVDLKRDEEGIVSLSKELQVPFETFSSEILMKQQGDFFASKFVEGVTGTDNVCERSVMAYGCSRVLLKKTPENGMTIAIGVIDIILEN